MWLTFQLTGQLSLSLIYLSHKIQNARLAQNRFSQKFGTDLNKVVIALCLSQIKHSFRDAAMVRNVGVPNQHLVLKLKLMHQYFRMLPSLYLPYKTNLKRRIRKRLKSRYVEFVVVNDFLMQPGQLTWSDLALKELNLAFQIHRFHLTMWFAIHQRNLKRLVQLLVLILSIKKMLTSLRHKAILQSLFLKIRTILSIRRKNRVDHWLHSKLDLLHVLTNLRLQQTRTIYWHTIQVK